MSNIVPTTSVRFGAAMLVVLAAVACRDDRFDELQQADAGEIVIETGELELDNGRVLNVDDAGKTIMVSGRVSGAALPNGFFVRTEGDRLIFIESSESINVGQRVQAIGVLRTISVGVFDEWQLEALGTDIEPALDILRTWYVDAAAVTPM